MLLPKKALSPQTYISSRKPSIMNPELNFESDLLIAKDLNFGDNLGGI